MADWSLPILTSTYTNFLTEVKNRDTDAALAFDPAVVSPTNVPTNTVRWNSTAAKWQKYNGSTWPDLAAAYAINISGNAATVTTNANLTGAITSVGNAASLGSFTTAEFAAAVTGETGYGAVVFNTAATLDGPTINNGFTEEVFAVSGTTPALSPTNGSIQTWTLSASSTPTAGTWADGQSLTLMVDDGTAYTITWTSLAVTWKTNAGAAPTLNLTGYTVIQLWKVGSIIYGARVGDV